MHIKNIREVLKMNPALAIIVIIVCIAVWFFSSCLYKPIGRWIGAIGHDAIKTMKEEDEVNGEEKE
jgi:ribose/xylose/arabinose/galactoside ABC-type transport system permease subunit